MNGKKIRSLRVLRGLSQEDMCKELKIDTSKYSRIETDTQKATAEMLEQIAKILGVSIADIMCNEPIVIQASTQQIDIHGAEKAEHFYTDQKELFEKFLQSKNEEIERLSKQNEQHIQQIEQLMKMIENKK